MGQESQRIIRGKQRKTDHISKDDQHKEVIQMPSFLLQYKNRLIEQQSVEDLPNYFDRVFQSRRNRGK